jgi:hypothetical protein
MLMAHGKVSIKIQGESFERRVLNQYAILFKKLRTAIRITVKRKGCKTYFQ